MKVKHIIALAVLIAAAFIPSRALPQEMPEMVTDRPDQTESTNVVKPGYVQIETGLLLTHAGGSDVTEIPGSLARIGLIDKLEIRIGIDGWIADEAADKTEFGDSEISAKYFLAEENGWIPESAILAGVGIPTSKGSEDPGYSVRYAGAYTLIGRLSAGFNVAGAWEKGAGQSGGEALNMSMMYSAVIGCGINDHAACFLEFFGESPVDAGGKPSNLIDGGFTYLVTDWFQFDAYGGIGMTDEAEDWFFGTGFSWLFGY
ncbi:transporter [Candidatus Latescibacterota bacterium]